MNYEPDSPHVELIELILQLQREGLSVGLDIDGRLIVKGGRNGQQASQTVHAVFSKPLGPVLATWLDIERFEAGLPPVTPIKEKIPQLADTVDTDDQDLLDILGEISFFIGPLAA